MRQALVVGNWKMHGSRDSVDALLGELVSNCDGLHSNVVVCPSYLHVPQAVALCRGSALTVGAQDCSHMAAGAYTGEVAADMLAELGCEWVILGHSERRQYHAESDDLVAAKFAAAVKAGLRPIVCVGETLEQRENSEAQRVVSSQLLGALQTQSDLSQVVVAYEPVWAIGTGLTASPAQAQEMHHFIRQQLTQISADLGASTQILYGGSVKPGNAQELFAENDIDGALVGGAALVAKDFQAIVAAASATGLQ